ncbi:MAG: GNAT family N-acetyltransferase [Dehalococcoidia bacterium]|nr:MAG: GNAT family N-acetyltransferase [Dehalococcoidia bacterium]
MKYIKLRKANITDMPIIEAYIEAFRLDNENLKYEQFTVAEENGNIVGFGRIKQYEYCSELGCVAVLEDCRNRSVGSALVRKLMQDFPRNDIWITTDIPEYFERFGFKPADEAPREIVDKIKRVCQSKQHPNAVIMLSHREET